MRLAPLTFLTHRLPNRVRTILGWTPGLRTFLSGRVLPCGCLTGTYETWTQGTVTIIDARGCNCPNAGHQTNVIV